MAKARLYGIAALFGLACLLGGSYHVYAGLTYDHQADTKVQATVVDSSLEKQDEPPSSGDADGWEVRVKYSYDYDGTIYTSTNIHPGPDQLFFEDKDKAEAKLQQYEPGSTVTAYIDPESPRTSRLLSARTGERILGGAVVAFLGLLITPLLGSAWLVAVLHPQPSEVDPDKYELREQFLTAFEDLQAYPVENIDEVRGSLDSSYTFESNDLKFTVRALDDFVQSQPETPCEDAEELTEYLITELEKQGYFYR